MVREINVFSGLIPSAKIIPRKIDAAALPIYRAREKNNKKTTYVIKSYLDKNTDSTFILSYFRNASGMI